MLKHERNTIGWENHIAIMSLCRDEWKHREQVFRSYFWRFTYLSLIITFFPNLQINPDIVRDIPAWIFSVAGIGCSLFGLYFGLAENKRITKLDLAYRKLEKKLPRNYRTDKIEEKYFKPRLNVLVCFVVYGIIIFLAVINLHSSLCPK